MRIRQRLDRHNPALFAFKITLLGAVSPRSLHEFPIAGSAESSHIANRRFDGTPALRIPDSQGGTNGAGENDFTFANVLGDTLVLGREEPLLVNGYLKVEYTTLSHHVAEYAFVRRES